MKKSHAKSINCDTHWYTRNSTAAICTRGWGVYEVQLKQHIEEENKQSIHSILEKRLK